MDLPGNEKKIQALFRELKFEDERVRPAFLKVWTVAQEGSRGSRRGLKISFALVTALSLITLGSLVLWSQHRQQAAQSSSGIASDLTSTSSRPVQPVTNEPTQIAAGANHDRFQSTRGARNFAAHRRVRFNARQTSRQEPIAISTWQSPTMALLQSPADDVLNSLPELNRSAAELNSFLPGARR